MLCWCRGIRRCLATSATVIAKVTTSKTRIGIRIHRHATIRVTAELILLRCCSDASGNSSAAVNQFSGVHQPWGYGTFERATDSKMCWCVVWYVTTNTKMRAESVKSTESSCKMHTVSRVLEGGCESC